jgi:L-alanine-DL-glutamate epimerase-like enolase superfamily enzyme
VALRLEAEIISLRTKYPFKIARHEHNEVRTVLVKLRDDDGVEGWGRPRPSYGGDPETVLAALGPTPRPPADPFQLEAAERR